MSTDKKIRFNASDVVIIIFIALCIVGIIFRSSIAGAISSSVYDDEVKISFTVSQADENLISSLSAGDVFYLDNGAEFGMLMEGYVYYPFVKHTLNEDGTSSSTQIPDLYCIDGVFTVTGRCTDSGFICSTDKLFVNSELTVHSKQTSLNITITEIQNIPKSSDVQ